MHVHKSAANSENIFNLTQQKFLQLAVTNLVEVCCPPSNCEIWNSFIQTFIFISKDHWGGFLIYNGVEQIHSNTKKHKTVLAENKKQLKGKNKTMNKTDKL